ncbi:MAG: hypothetical protein R3F39_24935 [Myxococcota bacterium]
MRQAAEKPVLDSFSAELHERVRLAGGRLERTAFEGGTVSARIQATPRQALDAFFAPAETEARALVVGPALRFWYQQVGVERGEGDGSEALRAVVGALGAWVGEEGHGELADLLRGRAYDARRVREAQLPWLVAQGHKPAAIVLVSPDEVRRDRWRVEVPSAIYSSFAVDETDAGKIVPGLPLGQGTRFLYCARTDGEAERLRALDEAILHEAGRDPASAAALRLEQGLMLGYPECCARKYSGGHAVDSQWHEMWLALEAGQPERAGEPLANFLLATVYGLAFFAHVPCGPHCQATVAQNQALLDAVFDETTRGRLLELLGLSAVVWPGGPLWVFRAGEIVENTVGVERIEEMPLAELIGPRYGSRLVDSLLESAAEDGQIDALRLGETALEVRVRGRWRKVADPERRRWRKRPAPRLALY